MVSGSCCRVGTPCLPLLQEYETLWSELKLPTVIVTLFTQAFVDSGHLVTPSLVPTTVSSNVQLSGTQTCDAESCINSELPFLCLVAKSASDMNSEMAKTLSVASLQSSMTGRLKKESKAILSVAGFTWLMLTARDACVAVTFCCAVCYLFPELEPCASEQVLIIF